MSSTDGARNRYGWLAGLPIALVTAAVALALVGARSDTPLPGYDAPSAIAIAPPGEPGQPLTVRGRVFAPDGDTAVPGVVLYFYQTDAAGVYGPPGERAPRLRGWVRTDGEGRYEVRTVRPGAYPGRSTPAHLHVFLWGAGHDPQWADDVLFADDPSLDEVTRLRSSEAGRFAQVCTPEVAPAGELLCNRDFRLKPVGDRFPPEVHHAFETAAVELPAGHFRVRGSDSYVGYRVRKLGMVPVRGHFGAVAGEILLDPAAPERSRATVRVPLASLESGNRERTATLLSEDFFDAGNHPEMRFVSRRVSRGADGQWRVAGDLTIRGITRSLLLPAEIHATDGVEGSVLVFSTRFEVDRRDFGVLGERWSAGRALLANTVEVELALTAERQTSR